MAKGSTSPKSPPDVPQSSTKPKDTFKIDIPNDGSPIMPVEVPFGNDSVWRTYRDAVIYRMPRRGDATRTKVAGLDLDGTLLNWRIDGWPSRLEHYELWNNDVIEKLRKLYDEEHCRLVIFSNQGAIRTALTGKKAGTVKLLIEWLARVIDRPLAAFLSCNKKNGYHKPSPNMWGVAQDVLLGGKAFEVAGSFFCGDSAGGPDDAQGGVDRLFAQHVGETNGGTLQFYEPHELFGSSAKDARSGAVSSYQKPPERVLRARADFIAGKLETPMMIVLTGAQGSGKSTFCNKLSEGLDSWVHFSQDTIKNGKPGKREQVERKVVESLDEGKCVIVDRMHLDTSQREHFVKIAQEKKVPVHSVVLALPAKILAQRVKDRTNHPGGVEGPSKVGMALSSTKKLEVATYDEGFDMINVAYSDAAVERIVSQYRVCCGIDLNLKTSFITSSGQPLPSITLGTMGWGQRVAKDATKLAVTLGAQAFDTAPTYNNEPRVGESLAEDTLCTVKVPKRATTAEQVREEFEKSITKLKRPKADLLLLHWPCDVIANETLKEVWQEMEKLVQEDKVLSLGVCNFNPKALSILIPHCKIRPAVNQVERHPLLPQWDLIDFCWQNDIVLQAHTPLGQGKGALLSHGILETVAERNTLSSAQTALLWNLQGNVAVVPRCTSKGHIQEILDIVRSKPLTSACMQELNEIGLQEDETHRFVSPPFMFGPSSYCWAAKR